jgi:hypothetical protein
MIFAVVLLALVVVRMSVTILRLHRGIADHARALQRYAKAYENLRHQLTKEREFVDVVTRGRDFDKAAYPYRDRQIGNAQMWGRDDGRFLSGGE